jgi:hypothetical protein
MTRVIPKSLVQKIIKAILTFLAATLLSKRKDN